jgi:metal-responsive CopG/Arc/MetJ family transcriptional regulator
MAKIAISVPDTLLDAIENERAASGVSRSAFFRRAVEEHLRREREREWDEQYVRAYRENPETAEELAWAQFGLAVLALEPWDEGDDQ